MKKVPYSSINGSTITVPLCTIKLVPFTPSAHGCSSLILKCLIDTKDVENNWSLLKISRSICLISMDSNSSTVVEHSIHNPKTKGSSHTAGAGRESSD